MALSILTWLGFGDSGHGDHHVGHSHDHGAGGHGHTHGVIDSSIATTERGIWAIKWSFVVLGITALLQLVVVFASGSVALLADTIHNVGDATTAIPLWIAFQLVRRPPTRTFNYGLGRVEDLAGMLIVLIILSSAIVAGYEAIDRLIHPQVIGQLWWVVAAGVIGFLGNEVVAVFRIRVGREIASAALIADGYHARTDGLTSLAVVAGALGVWVGFPLADPIVGLPHHHRDLRHRLAVGTRGYYSRTRRSGARPSRCHPSHGGACAGDRNRQCPRQVDGPSAAR